MIDWMQICENIKESGIPLERASRSIGKGEGYLRSVKRKQLHPRFEDGCKLLRLHLRLCGKDKHREALK